MIHEKLRPFAAFVGIDWADKKHDICLWTPEATKREHLVLEHKPKAIQAWAEGLRKRFGGAPVAVCIELSHGPIVSALLEHDFFVLFPVEPTTLARYRTTFKPSRAKDDPTDAELALDIVLTHPEKFSPLEPDSGRMRSLRRLVESRRGLVHDRTRITNRITNALKQYFPQPLAWFREKDTALFAAFLERWPSLEDVQAADDDTLRAFFREHNVRYKATVERRIAAIREERPLHSDTAIIGPARLLLETLLVQLRAVSSAIARFDEEITRLAAELPDYDLFAKLPGAGPSLAPRLLVAFGERRERFPDAASLQKYAGIAPVTERSGNKSWVHWRFSCPKFLRQTFVEWVAQTIPRSFWAKVYYQSLRARGTKHQAALRALAFKWIRILHRCWQDRVPYDEAKYLNALRKRHSPVLAFAAQTTSD